MIETRITFKNQTDAKYFELFCKYIYEKFGIFTEDSKKTLLFMKLESLMRKANIDDMSQYYHMIASPAITENQRNIQNSFVDTITIHKTNFFRENYHFEFLKRNISKIIENSKSAQLTNEIRVWCAASSTGEEAYTLAMIFKEVLPPHLKVKILATDISPSSLQKALKGVYTFGPEDKIPLDYINKYFIKDGKNYTVSDEIKNLVTFRLFNLTQDFPFKNPFDVIFCRNVMIYFDTAVQEKLINKFYHSLSNKGLLFIGHSESLVKLKHNFIYAEPTIYKKEVK